MQSHGAAGKLESAVKELVEAERALQLLETAKQSARDDLRRTREAIAAERSVLLQKKGEKGERTGVKGS